MEFIVHSLGCLQGFSSCPRTASNMSLTAAADIRCLPLRFILASCFCPAQTNRNIVDIQQYFRSHCSRNIFPFVPPYYHVPRFFFRKKFHAFQSTMHFPMLSWMKNESLSNKHQFLSHEKDYCWSIGAHDHHHVCGDVSVVSDVQAFHPP